MDRTQTPDYLNVPSGIPGRSRPEGVSAEMEDSSRSRRSREFRACFSILDVEMENELEMYEKKKANRITSSIASKGIKQRVKASGLFSSKSSEKESLSYTNFYDVQNELLEEDQRVSTEESENFTLRRELNSKAMRRTLWSRESVLDPTYRSTLSEIEKMLLDAALNDDSAAVLGILRKTDGVYKDFIECTDELGRTALHLASSCGNTGVVKILLDNGAQVEVWDAGNTATPLMCAASSGNPDTVRTLLKANADINTGYENGKTALYWACSESHYECVKTLLENGAKQSATAIFSETPIHMAASNGDPDMLQLLLDNGADVTLLSGPEKNTALHLAAQEYHYDACKLLVQFGAGVNVQNSRGLTSLHFAAFEYPKLTEFLLKSGGDPNIADNEGRTPLFYAVGKGEVHEECLELLLSHQAKVNLQDHCGYTALHIAAVKESPKCASILLRHGADLTLRNMARQSGLTLFTRRVPGAMDVFKEYLNDCITLTNINYKANVKLDFSPLVPNQVTKPLRRAERKANRSASDAEVRIETELLRCFLDAGQGEILLHPLVESFLQLKWQRVRKFFIVSFIIEMVLVLSYSSFILEMYKVRCPYSSAMKNFSDSSPPTHFENSTLLNSSSGTQQRIIHPSERFQCGINSYITWGFVISLSVMNVLKEIVQFVQCPGAYVRSVEKWALILFLVSLSMSVVPPDTLIEADLLHFLRIQYPIAAVGVCLAWALMFIQIGKFPSVGLYVQMLVKVGANFLTFLLVYGCIVMAYAMAFSILFPPIKTFGTFPEIILKLIRVMTGDVNIEYLIYDDAKTIMEMPSVMVANIIHTTCTVLLSVILMNLLVGLAVNDIQGLYRSAKLKKLSRQAELIAYLETFLLSKRFLYFLPRRIRTLLLKGVIVAPSYYKCFFYFHPNDKDDKRLPEELKTSILKLKQSESSESTNSYKSNVEIRESLKKLEIQMSLLHNKMEQVLDQRQN